MLGSPRAGGEAGREALVRLHRSGRERRAQRSGEISPNLSGRHAILIEALLPELTKIC